MLSTFANLTQRMFNRPVAIMPDKAELIVAAVADRLGITQINVAGNVLMQSDMDARVNAALAGPKAGSGKVGYDLINGVAHVQISGTLVNKLGRIDSYSGMMGYDGIVSRMAAAFADRDVNAILLDMDSPGGEVAGCFDLADMVFAMNARNGGKPIYAHVGEMACSAAYAIASAADKIWIPRTGIAGSIGVIIVHFDQSKSLQDRGISVTVVRAGSRKARGNPYEALDDETLAELQAQIDEVHSIFAGTVSRNRGLSVQNVMDTEAKVYIGQEAVNMGLADNVGSLSECWADLMRTLGRS